MKAVRSHFVVGLGAFALSLRAMAGAPSTIGVLELDGWNALTGGLSAFAHSADRPFSLMGMGEAAGQMLHAPNLVGVDVNAPIRLYLFAAEDAPLTVAVLPVTDGGAAYLKNLQIQFADVEALDGVQYFTAPRGEVEAESLAVRVQADQVVVASDPAWLSRWSEAESQGRLLEAHPVTGMVRMTMDAAALLSWMEEMLATEEPEDDAEKEAAFFHNALEGQTRLLRALSGQIASISVGFQPEGRHATLHLRLDAVPGTALANLVRARRAPAKRYRGLLPPDTLMYSVSGGGTAAMHMLDPYMEFMLASMPVEQRDRMSAYMDVGRQVLEQYRGDYVSAVLPDPGGRGVVLAQIYDVRDAEQTETLVREWMEQLRLLYQETLPMVQLTPAPLRRHAGIAVQGITMTAVVPGAGVNPGAALAAGFFAGLGMEVAMVDNDMISTFGRMGAIDALIDHRQKGVHDETDFDRALALFPEIDAEAVPVMGLFRFGPMALLRRLAELAPGVSAEIRSVMPMPGDGIAVLEIVQDDTVFVALRVGADEIRAFSTLIASSSQLSPLLQAAAMQMMQGLPPPAAAP